VVQEPEPALVQQRAEVRRRRPLWLTTRAPVAATAEIPSVSLVASPLGPAASFLAELLLAAAQNQ